MQLEVIALVLLCLVCQTDAWGRGDETYPHDVKTKSGLTAIYNEKVVTATRMSRPLGNLENEYGEARHEGVVLTTNEGNQYLVHKGPDFGKSSDTVVVDAKHMKKSRWTPRETVYIEGKATVSDFVQSGGKHYSMLWDNCQHASRRGMDMAKERGGQ